MTRKHAVKTEPWKFPRDQDGNRVAGWFIDWKNNEGVYFITPNLHGMGRLKLHSIEQNGEVNASVLVTGAGYDGNIGEYHEFVVLDDWDSNYIKKAGDEMPVRVTPAPKAE